MRNTLRSPKAHVYICGDSLMANAVTASLTHVIGKVSNPMSFDSRCSLTSSWHSKLVPALTLQCLLAGVEAVSRSCCLTQDPNCD